MSPSRIVSLLFAASISAHAAIFGLPAYFEANVGQMDTEVKFLARARGYIAFLTPRDLALQADSGRVRIRFVGGNPNAVLTGAQPRSSTSNYFIGSDPKHWKRSVPHFNAVHAAAVYPGIDVLYYVRGRVIEFDFIVEPGSDVSQVRLEMDSAGSGALNPEGDLVIRAGAEAFRLKRPEIYQEVNGARKQVAGGYIRRGSAWAFELGPFDRSLRLVIDPEIDFVRFVGGNAADRVLDATVDDNGNSYLTGQTNSPNFLLTNPLQSTLAGLNDVFVTKLDVNGNILFSTFIGGANSEGGNGIALDSDNAIYVTGFTGSNTFPVTTGIVRRGGWDTFVLKLNVAGTGIEYSTLLTGTGDDFGHAIGVDAQKNAFVTGITTSTDFPVSNGAFDTTHNGSNDLFLTKLDPAGTGRVFSTYLGGSGDDRGDLVDLSLNPWGVFLTGFTGSANLPVRNALQSTWGGQFDGLLAGFDLNGNLGFLTYAGGPTNDGGYAVFTDTANQVFWTGSTSSATFPGAGGVPPQNFDGFVQKLYFPDRFNASPQIVFTTFAGNAGTTIGRGIAPVGNLMVVGYGSRGGPLAYRGAPAPAAVPNCDPNISTASTGWIDPVNGQPLFSLTCDGQNMEYGRGGANRFGTNALMFMYGDGNPLFVALPRPPDDTQTTNLVFGLDYSGSGENATVDTGNGADDLDPVATATGELHEATVDLRIPGPIELHFERYYASLMDLSAGWSALGANWRHNFDVRLTAAAERVSVVLERGRQVRFVRSGANWQLAVSEPWPYQLRSVSQGYRFFNAESDRIYTFNQVGRLIGIEDRKGNALDLTPGPFGPTSITDGLGRTLTFSYTGNRLTQVMDQSGRRVQFRHTGDVLSEVTHATGAISRFAYTTSRIRGALMSEEVLPAGNKPFTQAFDTKGRVTQQTDAGGRIWRVAYNEPQQNVTSITNPLNQVTQHTHTGPTNLTAFRDADGQTATRTYDANRRLTSIQDRLGDSFTVTYHESGSPASVTNHLGQVTSYAYTSEVQDGFTFYNLSQINYPDGTRSSFTHDVRGNVLTFTDPGGKVWTRTYNNQGQVLTRRDPIGRTTTTTYNRDGTMSTETSPTGEVVRYTYDSVKRPIGTTFPDNSTRQVAYDELSNPIRLVDELGNTTRMTYTSNNRLFTIAHADGAVWTFGYDGNDRLTSITDPAGNAESWTYDEVGRLKTARNARGDTYTFSYNAHNWLTSITDPAGNTIRIAHDREGIPVSVTDTLSQTWLYSPDKLGRLVRRTNPQNGTISYGYASTGEITMFTDPAGETDTYTFDARGLLSRVSRSSGASLSYTRDDSGFITGITDENGGAWIRTHDASGRIATTTDPLGRATRHTFDTRGRVSRTETPAGSVEYTYDAGSRLTAANHSDGTALEFRYNSVGSITGGTGLNLTYDRRREITASNGITIARDAIGRISSITYAQGKTVSYTYNAAGLLARVSDWAGGSMEFAYNDARRLTSVMRSNGVRTNYQHDTAGRLTGIQEFSSNVSASLSLTRDAVGRVTASDRNLPISPNIAGDGQEFQYDAAQQVQQYTYDPLGRVTAAAGGRTYEWDLAGRMKTFTASGNTTRFAYDAMGLVLSATSDGVPRNFVWNYGTALPTLAVEREGQSDQRYYVYAPDGTLLYQIAAVDNGRRFFHFDEVGNTTFLSSDAGAVSDAFGITPYGEIISRSGDSGNRFTFSGRWGAVELAPALYLMRFRVYDGTSGRFLSKDPVPRFDPRSYPLYQYAEANPMSFVDPLGLDSVIPTVVELGIEGGKTYAQAGETGAKSTEFALQYETATFKGAELYFKILANSTEGGGLYKTATSEVFGEVAEKFGTLGNVTSGVLEGYKEFNEYRAEGYGYGTATIGAGQAFAIDTLESAAFGAVPGLKDAWDAAGGNSLLLTPFRLGTATGIYEAPLLLNPLQTPTQVQTNVDKFTLTSRKRINREFQKMTDGSRGLLVEGWTEIGRIGSIMIFGEEDYRKPVTLIPGIPRPNRGEEILK